MTTYHTIKIDHNGDCYGELDALKTLLRENKRYNYQDYGISAIVKIAVDELYDRLVVEKKRGVNQREI